MQADAYLSWEPSHARLPAIAGASRDMCGKLANRPHPEPVTPASRSVKQGLPRAREVLHHLAGGTPHSTLHRCPARTRGLWWFLRSTSSVPAGSPAGQSPSAPPARSPSPPGPPAARHARAGRSGDTRSVGENRHETRLESLFPASAGPGSGRYGCRGGRRSASNPAGVRRDVVQRCVQRAAVDGRPGRRRVHRQHHPDQHRRPVDVVDPAVHPAQRAVVHPGLVGQLDRVRDGDHGYEHAVERLARHRRLDRHRLQRPLDRQLQQRDVVHRERRGL